MARFRTGQRIFRIIDDPNNILTNATTSADVEFQATGLIQNQQNLSISVRAPVIQRTALSDERIFTDVTTRDQVIGWVTPSIPAGEGGGGAAGDAGSDPLSQTFFINKSQFNEGLFVSSIDLFFKLKDATLPVGIKLHPTINGYPYTAIKLPFAEKWLYPSDVKISNSPDSSNSSTYTRFTFPSPVYLSPGTEYAMTVYSDSKDYEVYVAELGQNVINPLPENVDSRRISEQPNLGSFFRSQNASVWTPYQNQDLMFVINRCSFSTSASYFFANSSPNSSNVYMDLMMVQSQDLELSGNTTVSYSYITKSNSTGALETTFTTFNPNENIFFLDSTGRRVLAGEGSANVKVDMRSFSEFIAPTFDLERFGIVAVEYKINDLGITANNLTIINGGTGYSTNNITVTVSGGGGSGANVIAYIDSTQGKVVQLVVDSVGSGYTGTPTFTVTGGGASANATISMYSELNPSGGNGIAKYISRRITLADGYDAGDLRIYFDAYKPVGTDFAVYYKIMSGDDYGSFDDKNYQLMQLATLNTIFSTTENDFIEFEYRPSMTANSVSYSSGGSTFSSFKYASIKIVFRSTSTTVVPKIKNLRIHALPASD